MSEQATMYEIPVPDDLDSIREIHDGNKWIRGVIPGTVSVSDGILTFTCRWMGGKRRFTLAVEIIGGYQCDIK